MRTIDIERWVRRDILEIIRKSLTNNITHNVYTEYVSMQVDDVITPLWRETYWKNIEMTNKLKTRIQ